MEDSKLDQHRKKEIFASTYVQNSYQLYKTFVSTLM